MRQPPFGDQLAERLHPGPLHAYQSAFGFIDPRQHLAHTYADLAQRRRRIAHPRPEIELHDLLHALRPACRREVGHGEIEVEPCAADGGRRNIPVFAEYGVRHLLPRQPRKHLGKGKRRNDEIDRLRQRHVQTGEVEALFRQRVRYADLREDIARIQQAVAQGADQGAPQIVLVAFRADEHHMPAPLFRRTVPHHRTDTRTRHHKSFRRQLLKRSLCHDAAHAENRTQIARRRNLVAGYVVPGDYCLAKSVHHLVEQRSHVVAVY